MSLTNDDKVEIRTLLSLDRRGGRRKSSSFAWRMPTVRSGRGRKVLSLTSVPSFGWVFSFHPAHLLNFMISCLQRTHGDVRRQTGSGRPKSATTIENEQRVARLIKSPKHAPNTHLSQRRTALALEMKSLVRPIFNRLVFGAGFRN